MSVGSGDVATCVSVCTKSVFVATVVVGAVVVVIVGIAGAVDSVVGITCGFFFVRQAGASTAATSARLKANDFTTLLIGSPIVWMISVVGSWPLTVGRKLRIGQRSTANGQLLRRFLRPIRIFVLRVECQLHQVGAVDAHPIDLPYAGAVRLKGDPVAVRRPGRLLVRSLSGDDAALLGRHVGDADLE